MKLAIATNSVDKLNGIRIAFSQFFRIEETEIEVYHCSVDSGVPEQPFDEYTYQGAINRVKALIDSRKDEVDFCVSCEAGIEKAFGQYFNVQVICIYEVKKQKYLWGKSAGWQVPSEDIEIIEKSNLDSYLRKKGVMQIEDLLGLDYSRAKLVTQATKHALASLHFYD